MVKLCSDNWILDKIDTVLFDKDGTFLNSDIYWGKLVELRTFALIKEFDLNPHLFFELCYQMGYDIKTKKLTPNGPVGVLSREGVINSTIESLKKMSVNTDFGTIDRIFVKVHDNFLDNLKNFVEIIEGAKDCFDKLKNKNVKLAVVTSDTHKNTKEILKYLHLTQYFDLIIGKDDCKFEKKTGKPALLALEKLGTCANNTISVGDAPMDYDMAKNANLKGCILVTTGQVSKNELSKYTHCVVENLSEVTIND